ncbi:hypothetical protein A264_14671 [Pseudomonas syringae pv. actinidiae ICMP 19071]|uniref:hypothetical protein n=1 Tax=Pseudomonas syringae TaxID=317 RepID=UPI00035814C5|nr:hypothetical protein [Pseudomonas syringae]EPM59244.1 hypothetical protein A264_14671 [Pseudomonas syringae pv. actinidiae ICMP 19071]EPM77368.1 hypothetical protein A3SO_14191 [Pseudomonas syringae pv. actinidiae ICMP 19072]OSN66939.1 hypothetical protein BV349_02067 [Pseudomonas syringae pv. actinidiae]OSN77628.1 hypothetical protein BV351_01931 [Pseudomonas syringae pv. actinidiae]RMR97775.1 hypothetical protein ALP75_200117 [Pseudomonas syringae pv. actinidiae]
MPQPTEMQTAIVFGSWKIRHQEPLQPDDLVLYAICADKALLGELTAVADLRRRYRVLARWSTDGTMRRSELDEVECHNLSGDSIPLAIITLHDERIRVSHLLNRIDVHRSLFVQPPLEIDQPATLETLARVLRDAFERNHLAINNWECRYTTAEQSYAESFELAPDCHARMLGETWFEYSFSAQMAPFTSQCGDEFQVWDHQVTAARCEDGGYLWIDHCSRKRKLAVNEPLVQLFHSPPGSLLATRQELSLNSPALEAMAMSADSTLQALGEYRRYAFSCPCESVESGNVFLVTFETCAPLSVVSGMSSTGTTRGEVRFLKARGVIDTGSISADLRGLMARLHAFLNIHRQECWPLADRFAFLHSPSPFTLNRESLHS